MERELEEELKEIYEDLEDDILKYPESPFLFVHAKRRIKKKLGVIFLVTGDTGRGKSYFGLRFLERWYQERFKEKFSIDHVCNTIEEAVMLVKKFKRKGEGILIEELSVHAGSRSSMTLQNKMFNAFLDICRVKQAVIVGNAPHLSFVDKHIAMMAQAWIVCNKIDFDRKIVLARPYFFQASPFKSEPYKHKYTNEDGDEIWYCYMHKPDEALCKAYEVLKESSNDNIFDTIILKLQKDRIDKLKDIGQKRIPPREKKAYELWLKGYTSKEGAKEMKLSHSESYSNYLRRAKERLKSSEYTKEMGNLRKNRQKIDTKSEKLGINVSSEGTSGGRNTDRGNND